MLRQGQLGGDAPRLRWLDALRGLAAMVVVLGHYYWDSTAPLVLREIIDPGAFGVTIFFMISGFIIPLSIRQDRPNPTFRFIWSRIFRLYPLYWLSIAFGAAVYGTSLFQDVANITMIQRFFGVDNVIGVYWTLQVEFLFYVIVAVTIFSGRFDRVWLVATLAIGSALLAAVFGYIRFHLHIKAPMAAPTGLAFIFVGNLRSLVERRKLAPRPFLIIAGAAGALVVAAVLLGFNQNWGFNERPGRFLVSYGLATLVFMGGFHVRRLQFRTTAFLGLISYPIYLIHQPLLELTTRLFPTIDPVLLPLVAIGAAILLAYALHHLVEMPAVRLGRALLPNPARQPALPVSPARLERG